MLPHDTGTLYVFDLPAFSNISTANPLIGLSVPQKVAAAKGFQISAFRETLNIQKSQRLLASLRTYLSLEYPLVHIWSMWIILEYFRRSALLLNNLRNYEVRM